MAIPATAGSQCARKTSRAAGWKFPPSIIPYASRKDAQQIFLLGRHECSCCRDHRRRDQHAKQILCSSSHTIFVAPPAYVGGGPQAFKSTKHRARPAELLFADGVHGCPQLISLIGDTWPLGKPRPLLQKNRFLENPPQRMLQDLPSEHRIKDRFHLSRPIR